MKRAFAGRRIVRTLWLGAALLLVALLVDGWRLHRLQATNDTLRSGSGAAIAVDAPLPELRFAHAYALAASSAIDGSSSAQADAALNQFRALQGPTELGRAARYNSASLLLRQAVVVRAGAQPGQAIALLELAKESLRELLREDPQHWDARYNLERAQRLLPDPPEAETEAAAAPRERERAATTMRAQTLGLP